MHRPRKRKEWTPDDDRLLADLVSAFVSAFVSVREIAADLGRAIEDVRDRMAETGVVSSYGRGLDGEGEKARAARHRAECDRHLDRLRAVHGRAGRYPGDEIETPAYIGVTPPAAAPVYGGSPAGLVADLGDDGWGDWR